MQAYKSHITEAFNENDCKIKITVQTNYNLNNLFYKYANITNFFICVPGILLRMTIVCK
jgi:hypothetical protein